MRRCDLCQLQFQSLKFEYFFFRLDTQYALKESAYIAPITPAKEHCPNRTSYLGHESKVHPLPTTLSELIARK